MGERAQDVQRGRGNVYPTELECASYRIDKCDGIMRKDCDVILKQVWKVHRSSGKRIISPGGILGESGAHHPYGCDTYY